ncbi:glycosyltransferase family 2 protein [bacterium]|nr:glycosyltransferase family 2 protein [candidate division CSSED10-310 bacterium]
MPRPDISLTFPCFNEEENVARTIDSALEVLNSLAGAFEVVVTNDGSTDRTREIAESYAERLPGRVRVVNLETNHGYGFALKTGLKACRYEWVFFTDGDLQFDLAEMDLLIPYLDNFDIVTGYRRRRGDPIIRSFNSFGWKLVGWLLLGVRVKDLNCAFRFYRKSFLDAISIESAGAMVNLEMYARAKRLGMRIKEVPVSHYPRLHGSQTGANPLVIMKAFKELRQLYRSLK